MQMNQNEIADFLEYCYQMSSEMNYASYLEKDEY